MTETMDKTSTAGITLPTKKVKASYTSPGILVMYSPPKAGKTTLVSLLDDCLIIDLENGAKYLDAMKVNVESLDELGAVGKEIHKKGKPYKYVAIDTVTKLEEWCETEATWNYMRSNMGQNFNRLPGKPGLDPMTKEVINVDKKRFQSVLNLPKGSGYGWLRESMKSWLGKLYTLAPHVILIGHLKDKMLTDKKGKEVSAKDIDLTGKLRNIVCAQADAIGYLHRKDNKVNLSFETDDVLNCGSRCDHLRGKVIEVGEQTEKGIVAHWDRIYLD